MLKKKLPELRNGKIEYKTHIIAKYIQFEIFFSSIIKNVIAIMIYNKEKKGIVIKLVRLFPCHLKFLK